MLIKNCKYLATQNAKREVLENVDLRLENGVIQEIGRINGNGYDASDKIVIPGLVNCHNHAAMILLRGIADDMPLMQWLEQKIWTLEKKFTSDIVYAGSLLACAEMVRTGTTTFLDAYFHMDEVERAVNDIGIRAVLGSFYLNFPTPETNKPFERSVTFVEKGNTDKITRILAAHAPYTCSPELLARTRDASEDLGCKVTMHVSETIDEVEKIFRQTGQTPIEYLASLGLVNERFIASHCTYLTPEECKLMKNVGVSHNLVSNLKFGYGVMPLKELLANGAVVGLGTDSAASNNSLDIFTQMRTTALLQKYREKDASQCHAQQVLDMATIQGAKVLGLDERIGSIEIGKQADLAFLDANAINLQPLSKDRLVSHLVYSTNAGNVTETMVSGKFIKLDGELIQKTVNKAVKELGV